MTAAAVKVSGQPDIQDFFRQFWWCGSLSQTENIGIIVFANNTGRELVGADGGTNALSTVGSNGHSDAGSTDQNTALERTGLNPGTDTISKIRVVAGLRLITPHILKEQVSFAEFVADKLFEFVSGVVRAYCEINSCLSRSLIAFSISFAHLTYPFSSSPMGSEMSSSSLSSIILSLRSGCSRVTASR